MKKVIILIMTLIIFMINVSYNAKSLNNKYNVVLQDESSRIYNKSEIDSIVASLKSKVNVNEQNINTLTSFVIENSEKLNNINFSTLGTRITQNTSDIESIQDELKNYVTLDELNVSNNNITNLTNTININSDNIEILQNDLAIKDSAIYNYIKADGTYENINDNVENVKNSIPNIKTDYIDLSGNTFRTSISLVHQMLNDRQSISADVRFGGGSVSNATNSYRMIGAKYHSTRGRYLIFVRSDNTLYSVQITSENEYSMKQITTEEMNLNI